MAEIGPDDSDSAFREGEPPIISASPLISPAGTLPKTGQSPHLAWLWPASIVLLIIQAVIALRLVSGTIGFDHAGTSGLDFPQAVTLGFIYAIVFFVGGVVALVGRAWWTACLQLFLVIALVGWLSVR